MPLFRENIDAYPPIYVESLPVCERTYRLNYTHKLDPYRYDLEMVFPGFTAGVLDRKAPAAKLVVKLGDDNVDALRTYLTIHNEFVEVLEIFPATEESSMSVEHLINVLRPYSSSDYFSLRSLKIDCDRKALIAPEKLDILAEILSMIVISAPLEIIDLGGGVSVIAPSSPLFFSEESMIRLLRVLPRSLKRLSIQGDCTVSSMGYLCHFIESQDCNLNFLSLKGVSDSAALQLARSIPQNTSIEKLSIEGPPTFGYLQEDAADALFDAFQNSTRTVKLLRIGYGFLREEDRFRGDQPWGYDLPKLWARWKKVPAILTDPRSFDNPLYESEESGPPFVPTPLTVVELEYLKLISAVKNKRGWISKLMDSIRGPEILENWKTEAIDQGFSENLVEIAFEEVCADARRVSQLEKEQIERNVRSCVPVPHALDMVYCGDNSGAIPMISSLLREKLISELRVLEDVPESAKDWHPESDNKVLDLIHPSLFPICFGKTGGLKSSQILANLPWDQLLGAGNPVNVPCPFIAHVPRGISMKTPAPDIEWMKFQWLPAEIFVEQDCTTHIRSYINNLHPHDHADLYGTIGGIFGRFVPLFEAVLTDFLHWPYPLTPRVVINSEEEYYEGGFEMYAAWEHSRRENDNIEPLTVVQPTVPTANEPRLRALWLSDPEDVLRVNLRNRSLQVIVKVASIHLTPEDPVYGGGVWHTEGMEHEAIVATGIYYYDTDNITTSKLSFRAGVAGEHVPYYQYDWEGVRQMYGIEIDKGPTQIWGSIEAAEGLCVAFPNVYQHKVEPFELVDKTRPGHRKILVFFLVNPNLKVPSSVEIPPQQMDWYWRELEEIRRGRKGRSFLQGLPVEVFKRVREILESMPWEERKVLTIEEAKEIRRELMAERKYDVDKVTKELYTREVSLCEH